MSRKPSDYRLELGAAVRLLRDAAQELAKAGGIEIGALDMAVEHAVRQIDDGRSLGNVHTEMLRELLAHKCRAWQSARLESTAHPASVDAPIAIIRDAQDIVAYADALLAALHA
jgi:hypothetical protein